MSYMIGSAKRCVGGARWMQKNQILMSMIVSMRSVWDDLMMILQSGNGAQFKLHLLNLYIEVKLMTEIYSHRVHIDIPKRVRDRIIANIDATIDQHGDDPDRQEDMIEDLIEIAYDSYHIGWQAGFIDDTQEDPDLTNFNPGGSK